MNNTNFLGLNIDQDLSWKHHIKEVTSKISKLSGIMIRVRHYLPLKTLQTIYNALVYPYLTYCNVVWASTYSSRLESIHKTQKKIVRIITFSKYLQETRPILLSLGLLTISELNSYLSVLFMFSYFSGNLPSAFSDYFSRNNTIHMHYTRSVNNLHIKFKQTNYGRFSVKCRGAIIWNSLPNSLKEIKSFQLFKRKLKRFVQQHAIS